MSTMTALCAKCHSCRGDATPVLDWSVAVECTPPSPGWTLGATLLDVGQRVRWERDLVGRVRP